MRDEGRQARSLSSFIPHPSSFIPSEAEVPMSAGLFDAPPLLTGDLQGIGGRIKAAPEDFEVEEIPAYEPCGSGDYLYLWVEKRGMGADYFSRQVARRLEIAPADVGMAG